MWFEPDGAGPYITGAAAENYNGQHVTLGIAWADIGGRRPLSYSLDLQDDRGHGVALFEGACLEAAGQNRLTHVWESRDSLRFTLTLSPETQAQDFEYCLRFITNWRPLQWQYGAGCSGADPSPVWFGSQITGWVSESHHGPDVTLSIAWTDIGGRRPLSYMFDLQDDRGRLVSRFEGAYDGPQLVQR